MMHPRQHGETLLNLFSCTNTLGLDDTTPMSQDLCFCLDEGPNVSQKRNDLNPKYITFKKILKTPGGGPSHETNSLLHENEEIDTNVNCSNSSMFFDSMKNEIRYVNDAGKLDSSNKWNESKNKKTKQEEDIMMGITFDLPQDITVNDLIPNSNSVLPSNFIQDDFGFPVPALRKSSVCDSSESTLSQIS